jgi:hypothetical protein
MRIVVIKERSDLKGVAEKLWGDKAKPAAVERLRALNPHLDVRRIEPGTVVFVPQIPGGRDDPAAASVEGEAFGALRDQILEAIDATAARVRSGHESLAAQRQDVTAVFKLAAVRKAMDQDPELKPQIDAAADVFKQDQVQARAAEEAMKAIKQQATAELAELAKLLQ